MAIFNDFHNNCCSYLQNHPVPAFVVLVACNSASAYLTFKILEVAKKYILHPSKNPTKKDFLKGVSLVLLGSITYGGLNAIAIKVLQINLPLGVALIPTLGIPLGLLWK